MISKVRPNKASQHRTRSLGNIMVAASIVLSTSAFSAEAEVGLILGQPLSGDGDSQELYAEINETLLGVNTTARAQQKFRFGEQDQSISLSGGRGITERWAVGGDVSLGLNQTLYPNWSAGIYPTFAPGAGWVLGLGYRHSVFPDVQVDMLLPGLEYYVGDYRLAYTLFATRLSTDSTIGFSHAIKLDHYYGERNRIGIGASLGSEREPNPDNIQQTIITDTLGTSLDGRHWWTENWGGTWMLGAQWRSGNAEALYLNAQAGLRRQF